uniref:NADH-ubiquinone oxidoreductase chain 3 n=1 Tax=Morphostenophanes sinicus TaxID=2823836 RepID=A0A8F0HXL5_9CUCU|nr:NADH dehydrogenase subunit 3 [Morphostenophanes sinicus]
MTVMFMSATIIMLIIMVMILLLNMVSKKSLSDREKSSPFECGFDPKSSARMPFSLHFFLIAIIFLIFDVEITLLFPLIITMKYNNMLIYATVMTMFIIILLLGLFHEWKQGALTWTS